MRVGGLNQEITYWAPTGEDRFGSDTFAAPELIMGRWEQRAEEHVLQGGNTIVSRAIVYTDRAVAEQGFLAPGDARAITDPDVASGAERIRSFIQVPDLRNVSTMNKAVI